MSKLNSKRLHHISGKEKESCCLVFISSTKREIRHFQVVVVQRRLRNVQKSVMHVQSCFFANINHCFFAVLVAVAVAVVVAYTPYSYLSAPSSSWLRKPPAIYFGTP